MRAQLLAKLFFHYINVVFSAKQSIKPVCIARLHGHVAFRAKLRWYLTAHHAHFGLAALWAFKLLWFSKHQLLPKLSNLLPLFLPLPNSSPNTKKTALKANLIIAIASAMIKIKITKSKAFISTPF